MTAMTLGVGAMEPEDIEGLLPWHATGTLNPRDARRVEDALGRDPQLAKQYALIQDEIAETIHVNETLGAPSSRAMQKLFTAIDAEPSRKAMYRSSNPIARIADFLLSLSPRTLAYSAAVGALAILLQAGVIGAIVTTKLPSRYQTAAFDGPSSGARALVRFQPDARLSDITQFLDTHNASIIAGPKAGMFRIQLGERPMSRDEIDALLSKLRSDKIVSFAEQTQ
jgi:hypothetical protein